MRSASPAERRSAHRAGGQRAGGDGAREKSSGLLVNVGSAGPGVLQPGEKFMTFANPFDLSQLIVCDAQCAFLGLAPRWETVRKDDIEGLHRAMGAAAKMEKKLLEPVARRGAEVTKQRMADAQWNAQVLSGAPMTEEVSSARVSQADLAAVNANDEDADYQISAEEIASVLKG
jgi:hypothetical protein